MATITTTKFVLLICVFALLPLAMQMMPLQAESAGTSCGVAILLVYTVWENYYFLLPFYCKMAIFRNGVFSRHMMHFGFIIKPICWLGWLCGVAFGQVELSDALTGSVAFPSLGITCIANLAVFYRCALRGAPKLEIGAKDVLATLTGPGHKLKSISTANFETLTTCSVLSEECQVIIFSKERPNSSMRKFMEYMCNVHNVNSASLQCLPLLSRPIDTLEISAEQIECRCAGPIVCRCLVFKAKREIIVLLVRRIPGRVKIVGSGFLCLLPCDACLTNGCHGCNQGLLYMENSEMEDDRMAEGDPQLDKYLAVWDELLGFLHIGDSNPCVCIPLRSAREDEWTKQLIRVFELNEDKDRGRIGVSSALKNYIDETGECKAYEEYNLVSLIIAPTLTEVLINIVLTFWFKVDGFSSALVARRAMKDYLPDNGGSGFSPIAFLTQVLVKSSLDRFRVCQVLWFRGSRLSLRPLNYMMGFFNLICSVCWIVLVGLEGGANRWYHTHSMSPSKARVSVIMAAIAIALAMDLYTLYLQNSTYQIDAFLQDTRSRRRSKKLCITLSAIIMLEILCIVSGSVVLGTLGTKAFGRWLYSALQCLVWIKWGIGNYLINRPSQECEAGFERDGSDGRYIYASAFFLNAILAGVRAKWEFS